MPTLVDIPDDKGVHVKSAGAKGEKYVYKYVRYFRNADKKPRNQAKAIGKVDPATGRMIPNDYYFALYHVDSTLPDLSVGEYGYTFLVLKVCHVLKLWDCLKEVFGKLAMALIVMAAYIIREGNSMDGLEDWQQRQFFPGFNRVLSSQVCSRIFASLTYSKRNAFFQKWIQTASHGGSVCYDVTSVSSYAQEMTAVERGYNRDGEDLPQYNLGMFCEETTKIPLYYNRYNGSLTDRTNLSYVLENAKTVGITKVKMVLDGGFWSKECIQHLAASVEAFTVGMPAFLKESVKILSEQTVGIETYTNELPGWHLYCVQVPTTLYGIAGRVLLFYNPWNHVQLCSELSDTIHRLEAELSGLKRYPKSKLKRYTPYFILTKHEQDNGFDYAVDTDKVEKLRKNKGYFLLFSTDRTSSPADLLYYYRAKDADEKLFDQIKVEMDGRRIRTHSEEATEGKTFVTFLATVIRSYLSTQLSDYLTEHSTSLKKVLNQLGNILLVNIQGRKRFAKALTRKQKEILAVFHATEEIADSLD